VISTGYRLVIRNRVSVGRDLRFTVAMSIRSGRETWLDDAAATPRPRERVLPPGPMEGTVSDTVSTVLTRRRYVDLGRRTSAGCR
jgi:hypothetical protein